MALRIKKSTKQRYLEQIEREPNKKIFIVCEGDRTEVKYFEGIRDNAKELGISDLLEVIVMNKDSESKGTSNPYSLIELANKTKEQFSCDGEYVNIGIYDEKRDKFLIVIDRDKGSFLNYREFIDSFKDEFILGVTNPCFELWLLLHKEDSVKSIIYPRREEILENSKVSNSHTFTSKLVSKEFHMNSKTGMKFSKFKGKVFYAIEQEKDLQQDLYKLENEIGSNIGKIIGDELLA